MSRRDRTLGHVPTFRALYVYCLFMIVLRIGARSADNWYVPIIGNLRYLLLYSGCYPPVTIETRTGGHDE